MADESMGDAGPNRPKLFKMAKDRGLSTQPKFIEWCATMDLIAIVTVENVLWVYRWLFWEKVWTAQGPSVITSLAWKPDGKILCTGDQEGKTTLYDTETGGILHLSVNHTSAVTSLVWTQEISTAPSLSLKDPAHHLLPKMKPLSSGVFSGDDQKKPLHGMSARITHATQLDVLVSVDAKNQAAFCAFGSFLLVRLDLQHIFAGAGLQNARVEKLLLSSDLGVLFMVLRHSDAIAGPTALHLARVYTWELLSSRRKEIHELAAHAAHMRELTSTLTTARADLSTRYAGLLQPLQAKFEQLSSAATSHAVPGSSPAAWQEHLAMALACGTLSPAMMQFFGAVSEPMLRRLLKTTEGGLLSIQEDIIHHLQPAAELCVHYLSHFHALCQWKESFPGLVALREAGSKSLSYASALAVSLEQLLRLIDAQRHDYKSLLEWLLRVQSRLNESQRTEVGAVDDVRIARFLEQYPQRENLVKMYLNHTDPAVTNPEALVSMAIQVPDILRDCAPGLARGTHAIIEQIQSGSEKIFIEPFAALASTLQIESVLALRTSEVPTCITMVYHACKGQKAQYFQYVAFQTNQHVCLLRCLVASQAQTRVSKWSAARVAPLLDSCSLQRVAMYDSERMAVLLGTAVSAPGGRHKSTLVTAPYSELPFKEVSQAQLTLDTVIAQPLCVAASCAFSHQGTSEVLAVMAPPRGVGCVYTSARRLIIFDMLDEADETEGAEGSLADVGEDKENQPVNE